VVVQCTSLTALLQLAHRSRDTIASRFASKQPLLRSCLAHTDADVCMLAARLVGVSATAMKPKAAAGLIEELTAKLPEQGVDRMPRNIRFEEVHGSSAAAGFVSAAAQGVGTAKDRGVAAAMRACVQRLVALLGTGDAHLAAAALAALGCVQLVASLGLDKGDLAVVVADAKAGSKSAAGMLPCLQEL
jgi:hypothetical protein